ncbi:hypothetical protein OXPF_09080 [Oxobacter pfennigii]|uniref:Uncharacterized protein n=1 Tax=Oxobacter pfennigii TaxID=36849 RepID=A0A0P8YER5_9CLOT|nr:hypothetical protein [Oxobacter pfennigii]KPU45675.1 hypothetical protein OXPF_09080 [Oxobacter pfennigii]
MMNRRRMMKSVHGPGTVGIMAGVLGLGIATAVFMKMRSHW